MEIIKEQLSKINLEIKNGKTYTEISRELNITKESLKLQLLKAGFKLTNHVIPSYFTSEMIGTIKTEIDNGLSISAISDKYNLGNNKTLKINLLQLDIEINERSVGDKYDLDKFLSLHNAGNNFTAIRKELKLSHDVCYKLYEHLNLKPNKEVSIMMKKILLN